VLYPATSTTKADVLCYLAVTPLILPSCATGLTRALAWRGQRS
jgi:hypothetical protein